MHISSHCNHHHDKDIMPVMILSPVMQSQSYMRAPVEASLFAILSHALTHVVLPVTPAPVDRLYLSTRDTTGLMSDH